MVKKGFKLGFIFLGFFILSTILQVLFVGFFNHTWSPLMVIRNNESLGVNDQYSSMQHYVPLDSISPNLILAVICVEDPKFIKHNGFDWEAINKAMEYNKTHKHKIGASTISQQTAKNVFMWQKGGYVRKGFEAYFTFLIETMWSKRRIMEAYLNIIEMGDGIFGAEAASQHYFDKSARNLSPREAAQLAVILRNPIIYSPSDMTPKMRNLVKKVSIYMYKFKPVLAEMGINIQKNQKSHYRSSSKKQKNQSTHSTTTK